MTELVCAKASFGDLARDWIRNDGGIPLRFMAISTDLNNADKCGLVAKLDWVVEKRLCYEAVEVWGAGYF